MLEQKYADNTKVEATNYLMSKWQNYWGREDTGRWAYLLILDIDVWQGRLYNEVDYK